MTKIHYNLTRAQKEILEFENTYPHTNINTVCAVVWLKELYNNAVITQAIRLLFRQEQGLRLRIGEKDGHFYQYDSMDMDCEIPVTDCAGMPETAIEALLLQEAASVFSVLHAPMCRFHILQKRGSTGFVMLAHHLFADGYTMALMASRIAEHCAKLARGETPARAEHRFSDYVEKEEKLYASPRYARDATYWHEMFSGWQGVCRLKPRAENRDDLAGGRVRFPLDDELTRNILARCADKGLSPATFFEAALLIYLHHKNLGKKRVDIGLNLMNRSTRAERETLGMFSAERLLCVPIKEDDTIADLYRSIVQATNSANYHGLCLHDEILEMVRGRYPKMNRRFPRSDCIRDVEFSYLPPMDDTHISRIEWVPNGAPEATAEITLSHLRADEGMLLLMDYRKAILNEEEALSICGALAAIVRQCMASAHIQVREVHIP